MIMNLLVFFYFLIQFLKAFENHFFFNELNHIIYPEFNLLKVSRVPVDHIQKRVHNIYKKLDSHPEQARPLFKAFLSIAV